MWCTVPTSSQRHHGKHSKKKCSRSQCSSTENEVQNTSAVLDCKNRSCLCSSSTHSSVKSVRKKLAAVAKMLACPRPCHIVTKDHSLIRKMEEMTSIPILNTSTYKKEEQKSYSMDERWLVPEVFLPSLRHEVREFLERTVTFSLPNSSVCMNTDEGETGARPTLRYPELHIELVGLGIGPFHPSENVSGFLQMSALIALQLECKREIASFLKDYQKKQPKWNQNSSAEVGRKGEFPVTASFSSCSSGMPSPQVVFETKFFDPICHCSCYQECCQSFNIVVEKENKRGSYTVGDFSSSIINSCCCVASSPTFPHSSVRRTGEKKESFGLKDKASSRDKNLSVSECYCVPTSPASVESLSSASKENANSFSSSLLIIYAPHTPWVLLHNLFAANWCPYSSVTGKFPTPKPSNQHRKENHRFVSLEKQQNNTVSSSVTQEGVDGRRCLHTAFAPFHPLHHVLVISNDPRNVPLLSRPPNWCVFHPTFPSLFRILPDIPCWATRQEKKKKCGRKDYRRKAFTQSEEQRERRSDKNGRFPDELGNAGENEIVLQNETFFCDSDFSFEDFEKAFHGTALYSLRWDLSESELFRMLSTISATPPSVVQKCAELR